MFLLHFVGLCFVLAFNHDCNSQGCRNENYDILYYTVLNLATHLIEETDFEDDNDDQDDDEEIVSDEDDTDMDLVDEPETIKTGV